MAWALLLEIVHGKRVQGGIKKREVGGGFN